MTALLLAVLAAYPPYVRTRVDSNDPNSHCLYWDQSTVTFQQNSAGHTATGASTFTAVEKAFASWQAQMSTCGNLTIEEGARTGDRYAGLDPNHQGENIVLFREKLCVDVAPANDPCQSDDSCGNKFDCWDHDRTALALTTTTFDPSSGKIMDADIELNGGGFFFTTVDSPACTVPPYSQSCVAYDIQNTVTHEAGHFLGLDHDANPASVMSPTANVGEISKRVLDPGSKQFVCDVYPRGQRSQDCVANPAQQQLGSSNGCAAADGSVLALLLLALRRRR